MTIEEILKEDERRMGLLAEPFDPLTGEGAGGDRRALRLGDFELPLQWVPAAMMKERFVRDLLKSGGVADYAARHFAGMDEGEEWVRQILVRLRCRHDFAFWAVMFARIKNKAGGEDVAFRLNRPQRKLLAVMERQRLAGRPIRVILLKARQWGGSTLVQMYMAWVQLVHKTAWNSTIASHANQVSATVRGMLTKLMDHYPRWMLHGVGEAYDEREDALVPFEGQTGIKIIPQRRCKVRIATAGAQENLRSEDVAMVHCTEVALWPDTKLLHPKDFVDACMSGMLRRPMTLKVLESTAKGSGNYFHEEWVDARRGVGEYEPVFIPWYEVENDTLPFRDEAERRAFALRLLERRGQTEPEDRRSEPGAYLWHLWEKGVTLEALHWYVEERRGKSSHDHMASEAPSDDLEAFTSTGEQLFSLEAVDRLRRGCRVERWRGEVTSERRTARWWEGGRLGGVRFVEDPTGALQVWQRPETDERITGRYVVSVDIGGLSAGADWSVICVVDRYWMMEGSGPSVVAQWRGHIDHDLLALKAAEVAAWYGGALLIIESNTLDRERDVNADLSDFLLARLKGVYDNLYERERTDEDIRTGRPVKYGFHTNRLTKPKIVKNLQEAVREGLYAERDERALDEMMAYEHNGARYEAKQGAHDDILMTRAIGLWVAMCEMDPPRRVPPEEPLPAVRYRSDRALV